PAPRAKPVTPGFPVDHFKGVRVLLVEDNPINQKVAVKTLEKQGFLMTLANHGLEALELLKQQTFDLILMDCQMPEMDGYEATRRIRAYPLAVRNIPIIAMTANAMKGDRERCLQAGMNDYITKPFHLTELLSAVNQVLKES
ncbi:MAG: response regulator, partial [Bdellovibrionales bacterium]|nr:response regulator [Oligoflexia bacterium]